MSILSSELILRRSSSISELAANGGIMGTSVVASNSLNAVFGDIDNAVRLAGYDRYRKLFLHNATVSGLPLNTVRIFLRQVTPTASVIKLLAGTQADTHGDLTGSERVYGVGMLAANVALGATEIIVDVEPGGGALGVFQAGDTLWIGDSGGEEFRTISLVSWATDQATITLTAGTGRAYTIADGGAAAACITATCVAPSVEALTITGTVAFDSTNHPIELDSIATAEESITLTFLDATNFSAVSNNYGALGSGSTATDFHVAHASYGRDRIIVRASGWTAPATAGDTVVITTHPASIPFWLRAQGGAGISAGIDSTRIGIYGETA